jgi:hypothetical protein
MSSPISGAGVDELRTIAERHGIDRVRVKDDLLYLRHILEAIDRIRT